MISPRPRRAAAAGRPPRSALRLAEDGPSGGAQVRPGPRRAAAAMDHSTRTTTLALAIKAAAPTALLAGTVHFPPRAAPALRRAAQPPLHEPGDRPAAAGGGAVLRPLPVRRRLRRRHAGGLPGDTVFGEYINPWVDRRGQRVHSLADACATSSSASTASSRWACATPSPSSCRSSARSSSPSPSWRTAATCRAWPC